MSLRQRHVHAATNRPGYARLGLFAGLAAGIVALTLTATAAVQNPVAQLVGLGFKFEGADTCAAATCHGGAEAGKAGAGLNSYTLWAGKDPHNAAYETLENDESKAMASKLGIAAATASERCLGCHSVNAPAALQGAKFTLEEGNSCSTCHGPSEKWREPHAKEGWTAQQRQALGHDGLLKQWGLFDTEPLIQRAERCTSCHLSIEADLVAAGHPTPVFDLDYYSNPYVYEDRHWEDPAEPYYGVKLWSAGQVVATAEAMKQIADRVGANAADAAITDAYNQAMSHYQVFAAFAEAAGLGKPAAADVEKLTAAVKAGNKADAAAAANAVSAAANGLKSKVAGATPDKAAAVKAMNAIAGDASLAGELGLFGVEQQAFALYSMYNAYAAAESPADADATLEAIGALFGPMEEKKVTDDYKASLDAVKGKLPK